MKTRPRELSKLSRSKSESKWLSMRYWNWKMDIEEWGPRKVFEIFSAHTESSGGEIQRLNACLFLYFSYFGLHSKFWWNPAIMVNNRRPIFGQHWESAIRFLFPGVKACIFFSSLLRQNGRATLLERKMWFPVKIKKNSRSSSFSSITEINQVTDVSHLRRTNVWMLECELWQDNEWFSRVCKTGKTQKYKKWDGR